MECIDYSIPAALLGRKGVFVSSFPPKGNNTLQVLYIAHAPHVSRWACGILTITPATSYDITMAANTESHERQAGTIEDYEMVPGTEILTDPTALQSVHAQNDPSRVILVPKPSTSPDDPLASDPMAAVYTQ